MGSHCACCSVHHDQAEPHKEKGHNSETAWWKEDIQLWAPSLPLKCFIQWYKGLPGSRNCKLQLLALSASDFVLFLMLYHFVRPLHHRTHAAIQKRYFLFVRPPLWQPSVLPAWARLKNISLGVTMSRQRADRALYLACFSIMCCWSSILYVSNGSFRYFPSKAKNEVGKNEGVEALGVKERDC